VTRREGAGQLRRLALEHGMRPLRADGWRQVVAGVTTVEEVRRVLPAGLGSLVPPRTPAARRRRRTKADTAAAAPPAVGSASEDPAGAR